MSTFHFSPRPNRAADIRWQQWGPEAFEQARKAEKPVLLAISAVWCHWCHVMDETTYSSDEVIGTINDRFVPIRVDNDQRPDINARYNQGGWPTTAVLTPDGELLKGATYVPPDQMLQLLLQVDRFYADASNRVAISAHFDERKTHLASRPAAGVTELRSDIPDRVFSFLDVGFDEAFGGFGTDAKFPQTGALHFLLDLWARRRGDRIRTIARKTLHGMAGGGMYDRVEGGFFRYSTTRDYSVPHFEKMLEDLGGLLLACARAAAMFGDADLARVAIDVRRYLDATLWDEALELYGGSQDADEEYYRLDAAARAKQTAPYVDRIAYASWNAETAHALVLAGPLLETMGARVDAAEWTARGTAVLSSIWSRLLVDSQVARYFDGEPHVVGLLGDQAWYAWAALAAHEATGDGVWLERARCVVDAAASLLVREGEAYADRPAGSDDMGKLAEISTPLEENALMARVLLRLARHSGDAEPAQRARVVLGGFADRYREYGMFGAPYGSAVLDLLEPPLAVKIGDAMPLAATSAMRRAARGVAVPLLRIESASGAGSRTLVCDERTCFARVSEPSELLDALARAR